MFERLRSGNLIINYDAFNYLEYQDDALWCWYKPKIKMEKVKLDKPYKSQSQAGAFIIPKGFVSVDKYFINKAKVMMIHVNSLEDSMIEITMFFENEKFIIKIRAALWGQISHNFR